MLQVDFHVHTTFSGDSSISPRLLVDQLHNHPSIKAVAITDHNTLKGYIRVRELARSYEDLIIIPGVEISTEDGDMIVLGVNESPKTPISLDSSVDFAKENDGVIVIPHPYRSMGIGDLGLRIEADAVEVLNPTATKKENKLALNLSNLPGIAGSDAHSPVELWNVYTEVDAQPSVDDLLAAISKGTVKPVGFEKD
jgi:predicted metal-dependent phosphoesterase TrpH